MSEILDGNKRTTSYDLASGDTRVPTCGAKRSLTRLLGQLLLGNSITKNGPLVIVLPRMVPNSQWGNQKSLGLLGYKCQQQLHSKYRWWGNCSIGQLYQEGPDSNNCYVPQNRILQEFFEYKSIHCNSNYVFSSVSGQPDELEKLFIYGVRISAENPSMVNMHDVFQNFPYKLVPEAMQEVKKIMQAATKDEI